MSPLLIWIGAVALHVFWQVRLGFKEKDNFNGRIMLLAFRDLPAAAIIAIVIWLVSFSWSAA